MSRVPDLSMPPSVVHQSVMEHAESVNQVLNNGKVEFRHQTSAPTDTPSGNELRLATISGTKYLYAYFKDAAAWVRVALS